MPPVPADATEYILSELTRRLNEVASRLEVGLNRMDGVYVRKDVSDQERATLKQELENIRADILTAETALKVANGSLAARITALEEGRQWLLRLCSGALATGLLSAILAAATAGWGAR